MKAAVVATPDAGRRLAARGWAGVLPFVVLAAASAPVAAALPLRLAAAAAVAAGVALVLAAIAYAHPPAAVYLLLVATPLTAGIQRDALVPLLRPHEALGLILGAAVAARALVQLRTTGRLPLRLGRIDVAILLMAVASSVVPLLWLAARGLTPTLEDVLYAAAVWKFYGLFVLVRASVRTEPQVRRCLQVSVATAGVVALIAILQALQLAGVADLMTRMYPAETGLEHAVGRGSATLASPIAVGDVMAYSLAICLGWLLRIRAHRWIMAGLALLFAFGAIASGQFSGVIAFTVAVLGVAIVTGHVKRLLLALAPTALVGAIVLRPVLEARLANLDVSTGLPQSWWVRLENLRLFVWPDLFSGANWIFGVRPTAVIEVAAPWGNFIYIESGHTWLLWTGGIPFFLAYLYFIWISLRTTASLAHQSRDGVGVAAIAGFASLLVLFVLMSFDPHLTMRGTADLLFSLLALAVAVPRASERADPVRAASSVRPSIPRPRRTRESSSTGPTPAPDAGP